jgi:hypothetical protein
MYVQSLMYFKYFDTESASPQPCTCVKLTHYAPALTLQLLHIECTLHVILCMTPTVTHALSHAVCHCPTIDVVHALVVQLEFSTYLVHVSHQHAICPYTCVKLCKGYSFTVSLVTVPAAYAHSLEHMTLLSVRITISCAER